MAEIRLEKVTKVFWQMPQEEDEGLWERVKAAFHSHGYSDYQRQALREQAENTGYVKAMDQVDLLIQDGETISLVGPSGCGKTTLLRVVAGLLESDEGRIYFDDQLMSRIPPKDRGIGMVFQDYALYPHMPSFENLAFTFRVRDREEEIPERVRVTSRIMGVGFEELLSRRPPTLSGGEKQRVAIARCIVRDPSLFLFDEPLGNLDAKLRSRTRVEIKRLLRRFEITSIYVTHDQIEAIALGDRIAVMKEGRIHQVGTYREVYDRPVNAFVAGFIGSPAMNFYDGEVADGQARFADFDWPLPQAIRTLVNAGQGLMLGIRPEHIKLVDQDGIPALVEVVEPLISEQAQIVHVSLGQESCVLKIGRHIPLVPGDRVSLRFDPPKVHFFDIETEKRLSRAERLTADG
ncbi:MAG: ABC transporter ATP-binding protein [Chloroflexota bacterium]|nr:ABC transporter ATP-binding protein [Chloroflexota bacterium]